LFHAQSYQLITGMYVIFRSVDAMKYFRQSFRRYNTESSSVMPLAPKVNKFDLFIA